MFREGQHDGNGEELKERDDEISHLKKENRKLNRLVAEQQKMIDGLKDKNEDQHQRLYRLERECARSNKRSRVIVESLCEWKEMGYNHPPLTLDAIPTPQDEYQRIELFNTERDKVLELKGFHLENQDGLMIDIDSQQISPGQCIGIALKRKKNQFDILWDKEANNNQEFCQFNKENEIIYLCDAFDERIQIFPNETIYDNLSTFYADRCPLRIQQIFNEDENFRGFEFINATKKGIKLKNMYFKSKQGTFRVPIPFKVLPRDGEMRLVVTDDPNHPKLGTNDIKVLPDELTSNLSDDVLILCDQYGNEMQIFPITEIIHDDLSIFDENNPPLIVRQVNEGENYRGFEFRNATKQKIRFKNMHFKNRKDTLSLPIPFKTLPKRGIIRLIVTNDPNHPKLGKNDLRVSPNDLPSNLNDDILILCDQYGNEFELYNMNEFELDSKRSLSSRSATECCIM